MGLHNYAEVCIIMYTMLASVADVALRGRNVLAVSDLSPSEIGTILALANHLRTGRTAEQLPLLRGKTLACSSRNRACARASRSRSR